MEVTIPKCVEHAGYPGNLMTIDIQDTCPKCGAKRGIKRWKGLSYDGSRRLNVDCWENECGHIDTYSEVREEYINRFKDETIDYCNLCQSFTGPGLYSSCDRDNEIQCRWHQKPITNELNKPA